MPENEGRVWRKAKGCEATTCIELAYDGDLVLLRNSAGGPVLSASREEWEVFAYAVRQRDFDEA